MSAPSFAEAVADDLESLRIRAPLVHNITNFVVMNLQRSIAPLVHRIHVSTLENQGSTMET